MTIFKRNSYLKTDNLYKLSVLRIVIWSYVYSQMIIISFVKPYVSFLKKDLRQH